MDYQFLIDIVDMYWTSGEKDNSEDLCLHGDVYVKIGDEVVAHNYSCTISSTALYLLKSLQTNHIPGEALNQMLPCCGHTIIPMEEDDTVEISGCPEGIDWYVVHLSGYIKLVTEKGTEAIISYDEYAKIVFNFVDKVEEFYNKSSMKNIPDDDFYRDGYIKFWKEWKSRRLGRGFD